MAFQFVQGDRAAMQQQVDWARETMNEESMHYEEARSAMFYGQLRRDEESFRRASWSRVASSQPPLPCGGASVVVPSGCARGGRRACGAGPTRGFSGPGHTPRVGGAAGWGDRSSELGVEP
ncbi:MAG: hypothetical protein ACR2IB_06815 [Pyrinomonadaceae bacterium]